MAILCIIIDKVLVVEVADFSWLLSWVSVCMPHPLLHPLPRLPPRPPLRACPLCPSMSREHQVRADDDGDVNGRAGEGAGDLKPTSQAEVATGPRGPALTRDLVRGLSAVLQTHE